MPWNASPTVCVTRWAAHGCSAERGVLFVDQSLLSNLEGTARKICPGVYMADRLVTGW